MSYDSYVNCSELKEFKKEDVIKFLKENPERVVGNVNKKTLKKIHDTIISAKTIPKKLKQKFGFLPLN